jgi:hypothetical protein
LGINYKKEGRFFLARYYLERTAKLYGYESTLEKPALDKFKTSDKEKSKKYRGTLRREISPVLSVMGVDKLLGCHA